MPAPLCRACERFPAWAAAPPPPNNVGSSSSTSSASSNQDPSHHNRSRKALIAQLFGNNNNNSNSSSNNDSPATNPPNGIARGRARGRNRIKADSRQRAKSMVRPPSMHDNSVVAVSVNGGSGGCPFCQPRYSEAPEKLGLGRPPGGKIDLKKSPSVRMVPCDSTIYPIVQTLMPLQRLQPQQQQPHVISEVNRRRARGRENNNDRYRRARSEVRGARVGSREDFLDNDNKLNGNCKENLGRKFSCVTVYSGYGGDAGYAVSYAEPKDVLAEDNRGRKGRHRRPQVEVRGRAKSRSRYPHADSGLLTVWPGKAGIWLPV
jgi:hypothetical protein